MRSGNEVLRPLAVGAPTALPETAARRVVASTGDGTGAAVLDGKTEYDAIPLEERA